MRTSSAAVMLWCCLLSSSAVHAQSRTLEEIPRGTSVTLAFDQALDSAKARVGQRVALTVIADVRMGNRVVIPAGSSALGTVAQVQHRGWMGRHDHLAVYLDTVQLPGGQRVPLMTMQGKTEASPGGLPSTLIPRPGDGFRRDVLVDDGAPIQAFVRADTAIVQQTASASN